MENVDEIEKLHLKFCKVILIEVHLKASNLAVYGELGRYPMFIDQIIACLKYLNYIENETKNKFFIEFYNNLPTDRKLATNCTLINFRSQLRKYY